MNITDYLADGLLNNDFNTFIKQNTILIGEGTIPCDQHVWARAAMDNPITYISEFKAVLMDVFSILLGLPASSLAFKMGADTHCKTRYFEDQGKGFLGHMLAWYMAIEDHSKGMLHGHLVRWGGVPAWILQNCAGVQLICNAMAEVLNSQFCATVSRDILVEHAICKVANGYYIANTWGPSKTPILLSYLQCYQMGLLDGIYDFVRMMNDQAG